VTVNQWFGHNQILDTINRLYQICFYFEFLQLGEGFLKVSLLTTLYYTLIHNYGNPYENWNIFVASQHWWLQLGMVKPEVML